MNVILGIILSLCRGVGVAQLGVDCHATTRGSIPSGNGVKTELHVLRKGQ